MKLIDIKTRIFKNWITYLILFLFIGILSYVFNEQIISLFQGRLQLSPIGSQREVTSVDRDNESRQSSAEIPTTREDSSETETSPGDTAGENRSTRDQILLDAANEQNLSEANEGPVAETELIGEDNSLPNGTRIDEDRSLRDQILLDAANEENLAEANEGPAAELELLGEDTSPSYNTLFPANNSTNAASSGTAYIIFNEENLTFNGVNDYAFVRENDTGFNYSNGVMTYSENQNKLSIPYSGLDTGTTYTVRVPKATMKNGTASLTNDIVWYFTVDVCDNNDLRNSDTEICKNDVWVECTDNREGQESLDGNLECRDGYWQNIDDDDNDTCSENRTRDNATEICIDDEWISCDDDTEGDRSSNNKKVCRDGEWITRFPEDIELKSVSVYPIGFNPTYNETKISYELTSEALIDLRIENSRGNKVAQLVDDVLTDSGDHYTWWNGTAENTGEGDIVSPGIYTFKLSAKDPDTEDVMDEASGTINVVYVPDDFEDGGTAVEPSTQQTPQPSAATVTVQNNYSGETSRTGPETLIYLIAPALGYLFTKRKI